MNKYKVIYHLIYDYSDIVGEHSVEFLAQEGYSYEIAESLKPNNPYLLTWMIDQIVLLEESKIMTNNTLKLLCDQLEESNDCMLALADTLCKYGHNTTDLLEQVKRNEIIIELCKIGAWING